MEVTQAGWSEFFKLDFWFQKSLENVRMRSRTVRLVTINNNDHYWHVWGSIWEALRNALREPEFGTTLSMIETILESLDAILFTNITY